MPSVTEGGIYFGAPAADVDRLGVGSNASYVRSRESHLVVAFRTFEELIRLHVAMRRWKIDNATIFESFLDLTITKYLQIGPNPT